MRTRACLLASWRQATQVRAGLRRGFAVAMAVSLAGLDVDPVASQLCRQTCVLAVPADGERELGSRDHDSGGARGAVDGHRLRLGGADRGGDAGLWVVRPGDDVDMLAGELAEDGAVSHPLRTDAGADGIQARFARGDGDLRAQAGLPCDG